MASYRYTAKDEKGRTVRGVADAASEDALYAKLRTQGLFLTEGKLSGGSAAVGRALKTAQVADYCRNLGTLLSAGVPLVRAFSIMANEEGLAPAQKALYDRVQSDLRKGIPLSDAMEAAAPAFPTLLISMIRSAEGTGSIDKSAMRMAIHYEKEHKLDQEVGNSLMYPAILGVLIVAVVVILMTFVLPQFADMFAAMDSLPLPTMILFAISDFVQAYWPMLILAVILLVIGGRVLLTLPAVRLRTDWVKLHAPVVGKLNRKICTARFARTLSNLYASGLPIIACLQAGRDTVGNAWIASQFDEVMTAVRGGSTLSGALQNIDGFENKLSSSIMVGEETGKLDDMLASMSETMDYEAEMATKRLMTLIEPVMIVLMALIVGFVIIAVILPIYQSYSTIGSSSSAI